MTRPSTSRPSSNLPPTDRPLTAAERQRLRSTANLWRALIPLLVVVIIIVLVSLPRSGSGSNDGVHPVDVGVAVSNAQQQAGFTLLVPRVPAPAWRATSTDFTAPSANNAAGFRIGYVSPTGKYVEFYESNDSPDAVAALYGPLTSGLAADVNGTNWSGYQTASNRQLIRHSIGSVTVIITGSAPSAELIALAASVR